MEGFEQGRVAGKGACVSVEAVHLRAQWASECMNVRACARACRAESVMPKGGQCTFHDTNAFAQA